MNERKRSQLVVEGLGLSSRVKVESQDQSSRINAPLADLNVAAAGLLLAAAPAIGYLLTWIHLLGYANQFDIPSDLIAPQLGDVLATTFGVGVGMLIIFGVTVMLEARIVRWSRGEFGPIEGRVGFLVLVIGVCLVLAGLGWPSREEVAAVGVLLLIVIGVAFWPAVRFRT